MQQNYEVIRFVQQQGKCHIVMDYVEGELLCNYLRNDHLIEKKMLIQIIISIAKELECLEKSNGSHLYPCLTPLHIVLKKDRSIVFLKFSERYEKQIEGKTEPFLAKDGTNNYVFSYGRTIQYILNQAECVPRLSWKEERKFKKIISKCLTYNSKKQYQNAKDIVNQLNPIKKKHIIYIIPFLLLGFGVLAVFRQKSLTPEIVEPVLTAQEILQEYLLGENNYTKEEVESFAKEYEQQIAEDYKMADGEFLFRIYYKLRTDYAMKQAIKVGERLLEHVVENREILANIYIEQNEIEKAIDEYEILLKENPTKERYLTLVNLFEQCGRQGEALKVCEEGSAYDSEGVELQLKYIKLLWVTSEYSIEEKKRELEKFLSLYPTLYENERFVQMKNEIGIKEDKNED